MSIFQKLKNSMNKGMDEEYFEEIKRRQMDLPQVSIINVAPEIFYNSVKGYSIQTIEGIINMLNFIEEKESVLNPNYQTIRNISHDEMKNRTVFQHIYTKSFKVYLRISLN